MLHVAIEKRMESVALKLIAVGCDLSGVDKVVMFVSYYRRYHSFVFQCMF